MRERKIRKGNFGMSFPLSLNPSGSPATSIGVSASLSFPDYNISMTQGMSPGFGQGFSPPAPTFGEKPLMSWGQLKLKERQDLQAQDFHNSLQSITNPQNTPDYSMYGMPDYAQQLQDRWKLDMLQNRQMVGDVLQGSSDADTRLLGALYNNDLQGNQDDQSTPPDLSQYQSAVDRLNGVGIDYKGQALSAGLSVLSLQLQGVGGPVGTAAGALAKNANGIVSSVQNLGEIGKLSKAGVEGLGKAKAGNVAALAGAAADVIGSFMPEKTEYAGDKGNITLTMDSVYDGISDAAMAFGPIGMMVGGIMKGGKLLGQGVNALGGGTDGMTTTDAILGSSFLNLTPIGLINGFGGSKTETITKDEEAFETVGASYTGSNLSINSAVHKSGKKYGTFSQGAKRKANEEIYEARRQLRLVSDIAEETTNRMALRNSMSAINGNRRRMALHGGYDLSAVRAGKNGLDVKTIKIAQKVVRKWQKGGKSDPFDVYFNSLPKNQLDSTDFRVRDYWEFNGRPTDFLEAVSKGMFVQFEDGWHANSVAENPQTGEIEFMKSSSHPSHQKEVDWYNSDDAAEFRSEWELLKTEPYWKYTKKKKSFKLGGVLEISLADIPEEFKQPAFVNEVLLDSILPEFKEGGKVNVIPDGALHARLHHMENAENLTKKGIPVVSEKEGGELEQLAEIEREELILRLEVTEKLELLLKVFLDEDSKKSEKDLAAIEAGKLLVEEILNNTIDNTNKLL